MQHYDKCVIADNLKTLQVISDLWILIKKSDINT